MVEEGRYPAAAFLTGNPVVVDEFGETDRPVRTEGIESAMYLPLGEYGTLTVCATEPASFEVTDREIAGVLAENTGIALDRMAREVALSTERDRLAALFENIPDPAARVEFDDDEPVVEAVNPAFEATFGHSEAAALGRSLDGLIVPADEAQSARVFNERIQDGESLHAEVRRETVEGVRDFLLHVVPRSRESATVGYAIYTDITEQRERERELTRQNERLEEFASVVSHDLRNPLNVAKGHLELARASGSDENFGAIERAHARMESRIDGLLELARHGRTVGEMAAVDLAEAARTAWHSVESASASLHVEGGLPAVAADPDRLSQLFENLLSNAVAHGTGHPPARTTGRATSPGRPDGASGGGGTDAPVTVTVGPLPDGFYVADDGVGLPEGGSVHVFEPGYSTAEAGTGFGLAIVRSIAEAHGWSVAATESADGGARFEFTGVDVHGEATTGDGHSEGRADDAA